MKLLIVIDKMLPGGGAQKAILKLTPRLAEAGCNVSVCCLDQAGSWGALLREDGFPVYELGCTSIVSSSGLRALKRLRQIIADLRPELIHSWLFSANVIAPIAARLAKETVSVVASRRDTGFWMRWHHVLMLRIANIWVDRICANSRAVKYDRCRIESVTTDRVTVIHNSIDTSRFCEIPPQRSGFGLGENDFVVTCVARFRPEKGHETLVRAIALLQDKIPRLKLLLVGYPPGRDRVQAMAEKYGVTEVTHFLDGDSDVPTVLASSDLSVLVSDSEGFSNFVLEAMAAGLPIVATAVGGNVEAVEGWGLLVPPGNPEAAADALLQLYNAPEARQEMALKAREKAANQYSPEKETQAYLELYRGVLQEKGVRA